MTKSYRQSPFNSYMMKYTLFVTFLVFSVHACLTQNILDALQLKEDSIQKYLEGELRSTDTIIDISNGYYEEFLVEADDTMTLRRAALFRHNDGSKLLATTIVDWDFACFISTTHFYEISTLKKNIKSIGLNTIMPPLQYKDFLIDTARLSDLTAYLLDQNLADSDSYEDFEKYLNEQLFDINFTLPKTGTTIIASLDVCDYFMGSDEWLRLSTAYFTDISLEYDRSLKKFTKR